MGWRGVLGGGRLTPEHAIELVVFRHCYHMDRAQVAALPVWERGVLLANGRAILGVDDDPNRELSDEDVNRIIVGG